FFGNRAADDFVLDFDAFASAIGLERDARVAVLAATAGLANEFAFAFSGFGHRFTISDLWSARIGADFEFAEQAVADDLQMQLAHAGDDELAGLFVGETAESWIFLSEALQAFTHFFAISLGLRLNRHRDDRLRE